jgi:hypothetical protein
MDHRIAWKLACLISVALLWKLWMPCAVWLAGLGIDSGVAWASTFIMFIVGPLMLIGCIRRFV